MPSILITGANRGLGFEFARQYAADGWRVYATARDVAAATPKLAALGDAVSVHPLEVTEQASINALAAELAATPFDVVLASAGVMLARDMTPYAIDRQAWLDTFAVNVLAPVAIAGAFEKNLLAGGQKKLVAISSRLGSIGLNDRGGLYPYRSSKAALNAAWKSLAVDTKGKGLICTVLHPGWVRTDMGGAGADIGPEESITGMRKVIAGLTPQHSGHFYNYDGAELDW